MLINEIRSVVNLDHRNLGKHDDVEGQSHVHVFEKVIEEVGRSINMGIEAELRHLEASSDVNHDVVLVMKSFCSYIFPKPPFYASSWTFRLSYHLARLRDPKPVVLISKKGRMLDDEQDRHHWKVHTILLLLH